MTIFICGDSTAASYAPERAPLTGWGQAQEAFLPGVRIANHAMAGRSTKSYLAEGRLIAVEKELQQGDLVLIQFTHNDCSELVWRHTDPDTSFMNNLSIFVETARDHGAIPVLLTPIPRREWQDGRLLDMHGGYPPAVRRLAAEKNVPLADVYQRGFEAVQAMGEARSRSLYMHVEKGEYPFYPDGQRDNTHTRREGAELFARITAECLKELRLI